VEWHSAEDTTNRQSRKRKRERSTREETYELLRWRHNRADGGVQARVRAPPMSCTCHTAPKPPNCKPSTKSASDCLFYFLSLCICFFCFLFLISVTSYFIYIYIYSLIELTPEKLKVKSWQWQLGLKAKVWCWCWCV
jgi:hypothetical protein